MGFDPEKKDISYQRKNVDDYLNERMIQDEPEPETEPEFVQEAHEDGGDKNG